MAALNEPLSYIAITPFQIISALIILVAGYVVSKIPFPQLDVHVREMPK